MIKGEPKDQAIIIRPAADCARQMDQDNNKKINVALYDGTALESQL